MGVLEEDVTEEVSRDELTMLYEDVTVDLEDDGLEEGPEVCGLEPGLAGWLGLTSFFFFFLLVLVLDLFSLFMTIFSFASMSEEECFELCFSLIWLFFLEHFILFFPLDIWFFFLLQDAVLSSYDENSLSDMDEDRSMTADSEVEKW